MGEKKKEKKDKEKKKEEKEKATVRSAPDGSDNQILKLKFLFPWFPCSHSFQKMYNTYMHPDVQKEKNWDNVKKLVILQGNFIKIFTS